MNRDRAVGRPQKSVREEQFQEILQKHKYRIELESRCLNNLTEAFARDKKVRPFTTPDCLKAFQQHG
jgi:hypothetical protein